MNADLVGRVRNTKLPARHSLMPLFEAVINSIFAIEEADRTDGLVNVQIERDPNVPLKDLHGNTIADVIGFSVMDNGVGFTDANYRSFETMDSQEKAFRGARGVGRLVWLVAFDHAKIVSTYRQGDTWLKRSFEFRRTQDGIENHTIGPVSAVSDVSTVVQLIGFKPRYRGASPKSTEVIARRIVEHCLEYMLLRTAPRMTVEDAASDEMFDLQQLFNDQYRPEAEKRSFKVGEQDDLTITDVLLSATGDAQHKVNFCAHNRVVQSMALGSRIPHLDAPFEGQDGRPLVYSGYVSGELLDRRVDAERTSFEFDREGELGFAEGPTWDKLESATVQTVAEYLGPRTEAMKQRTLERVREFVENKEPKYRPLLTHRPKTIERLSANMPDNALDVELHKGMNEWREDVRREAKERLAQAEGEPSDFEAYREKVRYLLGELQEVAKSDLAEYVFHRRTVLAFFEKLLGRQEGEGYAGEGELHGLFFPRRRSSEEVDYDEHSLWLLDERLAYHQYLASDVPFRDQRGGVRVEAGERPDLLIYNHALAFVPGQEPLPSVVVVEFKRPERNEFPEGSGPIRQVYNYVRLIRQGKARRGDGSTIEPPVHLPFYCYVVATLTDVLKRDAEEAGLIQAPDGQGYFGYNPTLQAYIEVSGYRKVLEDAKKRNRAFIDRLGISVP